MSRGVRYASGLAVLTLLLFTANLFWGSVSIPADAVWRILSGSSEEKTSWTYIILENRIPQAVTALLCGASLSTAGLLLQTAFRNALAGPSILGIDSGASLGVALAVMFFGGSFSAGTFTLSGFVLLLTAALSGAFLVMGILLFLSSWLRNSVMLLIAGIMVSYITSSAISLLNYTSTAEGVHAYMVWGMGSFSSVSLNRLPAFALSSFAALLLSVLLIKPLNALLLGDRYASNLGINVHRTRYLLLAATSLLTAVCTAFCGPISFIGLAVPHLARMLLGTANHRQLLPATLLTGSSLSLLCNLLSTLPGDAGLIPLNVITPVLGAPVVIYVILKQRV